MGERVRQRSGPLDIDERKGEAASNVLDRQFTEPAPNQQWAAHSPTSGRRPLLSLASVAATRHAARMIKERASQIRDLVSLTIEKHGIKAPSAAQFAALKAVREGDDAAAATWREVATLAEAALSADLEA
jgi:hypothetical protein